LATVVVGRADRRDDRLAGQDHHVADLLEEVFAGQEGPIGGTTYHLRAPSRRFSSHVPTRHARREPSSRVSSEERIRDRATSYHQPPARRTGTRSTRRSGQNVARGDRLRIS